MKEDECEILDALPIVVVAIDANDQITFLNRAAREFLLGEESTELEPKAKFGDFLASEEVLGLIGAYEAAEKCLVNTNVLLRGANQESRSFVVNGRRFATATGEERALLVAQHQPQLQEELAQSTRWAAAQQDRADEISRVHDALQLSHNRLRETQAKLISASRLAGMAEIASGAIHNIGNVLNGASVGIQLLRNKLGSSRLGRLDRVVQTFAEYFSQPEGVRQGDRARAVMSYFEELVVLLAQERREVLAQLEEVSGKIDHIKNVVGSQQRYARGGGVCETFRLAEVVEQAISLQRSIHSNRVEVIEDLNSVDNVTLDRHFLLQILVNLITNAENSMIENNTPVKRLTIRSQWIDSEYFRVDVVDTGIGIETGLLERIFAHGFTTRRSGSGFGLHNAVLLAKQMGGQMGAKSDGLGKGATFWVKLPRNQTFRQPSPHEPSNRQEAS
jgi:signal transduction histidine kinase